MKSITIITGAAGTGKTEQIKHKAATLYEQKKPVLIVAPTNKAAKVLRSRGIQAKTIHSGLYKSSKTGETKQILRPVIDPNTNMPAIDKSGATVYSIEIEDIYEYTFNKDFSPAWTIIIDEASMINSKIWYDLHQHFPGDLIVVGDPEQLMPVESDDDDEVHSEFEQYFNRLAPHADIHLGDNSSNKRLAEDTAGIAMAINHIASPSNFKGEFPSLFGNEDIGYTHLNIKQTHTLDQMLQDLLPEVDAIICWRNSECDFINQFVRKKKFKEQFDRLPLVGDRLYAENRYTHPGEDEDDDNKLILTKGDELIIRELGHIDYVNNIMWVKCHDVPYPIPLSLSKIVGGRVPKGIEHLRWSYAYAITCHKAQGSGWDNVIVLDSYTHPKDAKRWRYTAATRAKKNLVVVVSNESFEKVRLS